VKGRVMLNTSRARITFVLPGYPWKPVGGYRVVYEYANYLAEQGFEVAVVHPRRLRQPVSMTISPFKTIRQAAGRLRDVLVHPRVTWQRIDPRVRMVFVPELLERYIPDGDAVVATAWQTAEYVNEYPQYKGRKFYLIQHYEVWSGPKERVDATWRFPMKKIVISKWLYELGIQLGIPANDLEHIPNGIDHSKFRVTRPIEERPKRVAMLYHSAEWKGCADGLKALEAARSACPDIRAVLFGAGSRRPALLPKWADYVPNPPQHILVNDIYNGSSVYLCPSWTEGWSLPPAEAMACGCAVVSTDNGGIRDYAVHGETALLSPPREPAALAENLIQVLKDDKLRLQLARAGNSSIRRFTWESAGDRLVQYLLRD